MNGFVKDAENKGSGWGNQVMSCFNPRTVPAISTLASEFVVFDRWFSSFPGPTDVNRMFANAATSGGLTENDAELLAIGMPQDTIYQVLEKQNISFNIYMAEVSCTLFFSQMRSEEYLDNYKLFENFDDDVSNGNLATYTFVEPRYFSASPLFPANDQHPSHDVAQGELLIKNVYDTLRKSKFWNSTALIITYDEHGGFYDHYPPPMGVPNPDGITSSDPICYFDRLGVRIPTVLVSPWVAKGRVVHEPTGPASNSQFEHSSLLSTLKNMFQLPHFLTNRDAWAGSFEFVFDELSEPRTDCPVTIPAPPVMPTQDRKEYLQPLNDLQRELIRLAASLNSDAETAIKISNLLQTEAEGAEYVTYEVQRFIKRSLQGVL
jgi:phospholipase C